MTVFSQFIDLFGFNKINKTPLLKDLPYFPKTKLLEFSDMLTMNNYLIMYPPYSDFSFLSLWSFNTEEDFEISRYKENLIIRMRDYISNQPFYTIIGTSNIDKAIQEIFIKLKKDNQPQIINIVPETAVITIRNTDQFNIVEDRNNFDYVYSVNSLAELKGGSMHKLKNYVNRFQDEYPKVKIKELNISDPTITIEILNVFDEWAINKGDSTVHERKALSRTLSSANALENIHSIGLYDNFKLIAFMILDLRSDNYAQSHFAKAITATYHGIFSYLYHQTAISLLQKGYEFINFEQDMGIEGLRRAKEQMNPAFYLKKYNISPKIS